MKTLIILKEDRALIGTDESVKQFINGDFRSLENVWHLWIKDIQLITNTIEWQPICELHLSAQTDSTHKLGDFYVSLIKDAGLPEYGFKNYIEKHTGVNLVYLGE